MKEIKKGRTREAAAAKAGVSARRARRYVNSGKIPSQMEMDHTWRTRKDPFTGVWEEVREKLALHPGLEAKTLFEDLQRSYPGRFQDGQLRTLQRQIKAWRATEGPGKEVFFPQVHTPGRLGQSDFTDMRKLLVTIQGRPFPHLLYHFVLTFSNWETGTVCFSESFESLSEGLQNALWELGGAPKVHQTDSLSAAVNNLAKNDRDTFTRRYAGLLDHYGLDPRTSNPSRANENGDVEQRHYRFKRAMDQRLMLRGSRDFESRAEYERFLRKLFNELNSNRSERFGQELEQLHTLPNRRLEDCKREVHTVRSGSTIPVNRNVYSVPSRLIGEKVQVRLYAEHVDVWYGQKRVETMPRLRGSSNHQINYRHVIDWLVRKPGAFDNYRYREEMFPTSQFRIAFDWLVARTPARAAKEYLKILYLAARENESGVNDVLRTLIRDGRAISFEHVEALLMSSQELPRVTDVQIAPVDLSLYDALLDKEEVRSW